MTVRVFITIVLLIITIFVSVVGITGVNNAENCALNYDELIYKEYKVRNITIDYNQNTALILHVEEEDLPLYISEVCYEVINDAALTNLGVGDTITCYVLHATMKSYSYEIAEIKSENRTILSLDNYNSARIEAQKTFYYNIRGLIVPFFMITLVAITGCIWEKKYKKANKKY